jgi:hypothetical protein
VDAHQFRSESAMTDALANSIAHVLLGSVLGPNGEEAGNRLSLEGVRVGSREDGALDIRVGKLEAASLRLVAGPFALEVERLSVHQLAGSVRIDAGGPRVDALQAASAELAGV